MTDKQFLSGCLQQEKRWKWQSAATWGRTKGVLGRHTVVLLFLLSICGFVGTRTCVDHSVHLWEETTDAFIYGELKQSWYLPPLKMLALRMEQGRRGGGEIDRLQKGATVAWQGRQAGRPPSHEQGINIREKISQWEGRSQDAGVKAHPPTVSRTLSGDLLGRGGSNDAPRMGLHTKAKLTNANGLSLDLQESPGQTAHGTGGRKSEPLQRHFSDFSAQSPGNKPSAEQIFASSTTEKNSTCKQSSTANGDQKLNLIAAGEDLFDPLPLSDDHEDMPAGNFYTSRGFWRKLEGDRLLWEKGRESSGEAQPPPKPQRTFQYRGANSNNTMHTAQWEVTSPLANRSNVRSRRVAHPPSFPPPPCPVVKSHGLSRRNKNR